MKQALEAFERGVTAALRTELKGATSRFVRATVIGNSISVATVAGLAFAAARLT